MVDLEQKFSNHYFTSLKEASLDTINNIPLVDNTFTVLKLDDFNKNKYQQELGCRECLRGADACFIKNDKIYLIEFKNRYPTPANIYEILEKMYASCIVLMDKMDIKLSEFKRNTCFITVYTFKEGCSEKELYSDESIVIPNKGLKKIQSSIASRSTRKIKDIDNNAFGLKKLEKYIYNEVIAIPACYFQRYLKEEEII